MTGAELFSWYGVGFFAVFCVGLVMLVVGMMGLGHEGGPDAAADHDASLGDAKAALSGNSGHDSGDPHSHSVLLDFLGVGRCPMSIVLMVLCFLFSLTGIATVIIARMFYAPGIVVGALAYPIALVSSFLLTGSLARVIGRWMPTTETYVSSEAEHIGSLGEAVYAFKDGRGFVQVKDKSGTMHEVSAVNDEPEKEIAAGRQVIVVDYDEGSRTFHVQPAPSQLR